jgi:hypothetical protein
LNLEISFEPPPTLSKNELKRVGVLGDMIATSCLIEYFWTPPTQIEICLCLMKLFSWHGDLLREAKRKKKEIDNKNPQPVNNLQEILPKVLPKLWILTTSAPKPLLEDFEVKSRQPQWCKGVYFLSKALNTGIVVLDELPETNETVWLRILGKGKTQQQAIETLTTLEDQGRLLFNVLDVFYKWHEDTKTQDQLTPEDKELLMILSPAYEKSRTQAILQERQFYVENLLKLRFGVDKALSQLIEPLVQMPREESLRLLMHSSREELLAQFNQTGGISSKTH